MVPVNPGNPKYASSLWDYTGYDIGCCCCSVWSFSIENAILGKYFPMFGWQVQNIF